MILVTLVCLYLACWMQTRTQGVDDIAMHVTIAFLAELHIPNDDPVLLSMARDQQASSNVPFVVGVPDSDGGMWITHQEYYFWFFGYVAKLPFERDVR